MKNLFIKKSFYLFMILVLINCLYFAYHLKILKYHNRINLTDKTSKYYVAPENRLKFYQD